MIKNRYKSSKKFKIFVHIFIGMFRLALNIVILSCHKIYHNKNIKHIAFVGPIHSQHFVNFLEKVEQHFAKDDIKIIQINSDPNYLSKDFSFNKLIIDGSIYTLCGYYLSREEWQRSLFFNAVNRIGWLAVRYTEFYLTLFQPDILWIHDLQSGGYLAENFIKHFKRTNPRVTYCASVYGNDLYFFGCAPLHKKKLKVIVENMDFLHVESEREKDIALNLGFGGRFFPVSNVTMTNVQKFKNFEVDFKVLDKDIFVVVKGSYFLRSNLLSFLDEVEINYIFWKDKKIFVVSATDEDIFHILRVKYRYNLDLDYCKSIPHKDFVLLLSRAQFFLTLNLSDGIPNAAAEATYVNCIPVFSHHTGLSNSLTRHIRDLIVYEFGRVSFKHLFSLLEDLTERDKIFVIDNLKKIFNDKLYNEEIQREILDVVIEDSKERNRKSADVRESK